MSGAVTVVAIVLFLVFLVGVVAGIAMVIAASVRRAERVYRRNRPVERERSYLPEVWLGDDEPDDTPRWPTPGGY